MWLQNGKKDSPLGDNPMNIQLKRFQVTVVIFVVGVEKLIHNRFVQLGEGGVRRI